LSSVKVVISEVSGPATMCLLSASIDPAKAFEDGV
jgi:hypothetical protein